MKTHHKFNFILIIVLILMVSGLAIAQMPVARLPLIHIDTTYSVPTGGTTWAAHTPAQLTSALKTSQPGDIIVLDAGVTYTGHFQLPAKDNPNNKWIYIVSSAVAKLPPGRRVTPKDAVNMAKIVTPNTTAANTLPAFQVNGGANHWRLVGLELTSASTYVPNPSVSPNGYSYFLVGSQSNPTPLPDSITIDRCYIHGSPTQDIKTGIQGTASNYAVVDSYISDIHAPNQDSQAFGAYDTPGPIKLVNNYLEAAGENVMLGGAGGNNNRGVPSDIEIRNNYLFKPLSWVSKTIAPINQWVEKNAFECKSCQRVLFDSNTIENVWVASQKGYAIVLTVRSSQSGDFAVVNDITITNNVLKNVVSGFNTLAKDDTCGLSPYTACKNAGSQDRWRIANNLIMFYPPSAQGGGGNTGIIFNGGMDRITDPANPKPGIMRDVVLQHNTFLPASNTNCSNSIWFSWNGKSSPVTNNIWIQDNVLCRQPTGDYGYQGMAALNQYMGTPGPVDPRFLGNVMYVPAGDKLQTFPIHTYATTVPFTYVAPGSGDYHLATPYWTDTSDGKLAGIN